MNTEDEGDIAISVRDCREIRDKVDGFYFPDISYISNSEQIKLLKQTAELISEDHKIEKYWSCPGSVSDIVIAFLIGMDTIDINYPLKLA